jgi:hypothetical protein
VATWGGYCYCCFCVVMWGGLDRSNDENHCPNWAPRRFLRGWAVANCHCYAFVATREGLGGVPRRSLCELGTATCCCCFRAVLWDSHGHWALRHSLCEGVIAARYEAYESWQSSTVAIGCAPCLPCQILCEAGPLWKARIFSRDELSCRYLASS